MKLSKCKFDLKATVDCLASVVVNTKSSDCKPKMFSFLVSCLLMRSFTSSAIKYLNRKLYSLNRLLNSCWEFLEICADRKTSRIGSLFLLLITRLIACKCDNNSVLLITNFIVCWYLSFGSV